MRLNPRLITIGFPMALILFSVPPSSATVLPDVEPYIGLPIVTSPPPVALANVFAPYLPETVVSMPESFTSPAAPVPESFTSPATAPSSQPVGNVQPVDNVYDFLSYPEVNTPSSFSPAFMSPMVYPVASLYQAAPVRPMAVSAPVSLLYTGPVDAPYGPGGVPILLGVAPPAAPASDLFSAAPVTPDVTTNFNNSPLHFAPAFAVPEPRLASLMAVAAALALGILVARRRKKEAESSSQPASNQPGSNYN